MRQYIRKKAQRVKDAVERRSSPQPLSGRREHSGSLSQGSVSHSALGHNTAGSVAQPPPEPDRPTSAPPIPSPLGQSKQPTTLSPTSTCQPALGISTPAPIAGPPSESDGPTNAPLPMPSTPGSVLNAGADAVPAPPIPESAAWKRLTQTLSALKTSVELFPPLQSAISALIGCLDIVQAAASNRKDYEEIVDELESIANFLAQDAEELALEPSKGSIANITQCIERQVAEIKQKADRGNARRLFESTKDEEDVIRQYRRIERLFRQLQCDLAMRTKNISKKHFETTLLGKMSPVDDAKYNSSYSTTVRRRGCTAETREAIHRTLQDWTTDPKREAIYWMNGMAGTGKTTIAYSFCRWLESTNRLGASFFCSRISSSCRSLNQIVPTLAYQLAHFSPAFRSTLCTALNDTPDAGKLNVMQQFESLINQPMLEAKDAFPDSIVVVIDALDECDDNYSVNLLLDVLFKFADQLPLKFFVSSRPEHVIRERMVSQGGAKRAIVHLHDIEQSIVEEDIKKYLTEAFSTMSPPPSTEQIGLLAKRSRNLFIYAATVVRYIHPGDFPVDSGKRLESMLKAISDPRAMGKNKYEDLDHLYTTVLRAVFHSRLDPDEKAGMQRVLWTVVCAKEPVTVATIASLTSLEEREVWPALQSLRSVIHVPENNTLISTLHASFPEYMLDKSRSKKFYCNEPQSNERLVHQLFKIMKLELRFNICDLKNSYVYDSQVDDLEAQVTQHISPTLSYSCRYWSAHLLLASSSNDTRDMLTDLLMNRLLFWMEALSLCRCVGSGAPMLQQAQTWLQVGVPFLRFSDQAHSIITHFQQVEGTPEELQKRVSDARNFVTWFAANPCFRSTPHIYISALPFCAKSNWVYQHYSKRFQGLGSIDMNQRDESTLAIWTAESEVYSISISPDGSRVAAGTGDGSIHLYDMNTGAITASFKGHTNLVQSVAFSPDGSLLSSSSSDKSVIIWDTHIGRIVTGPLTQHTDWVRSVAFSPDGKRLVSGSDDRTVFIWGVSNGAITLGPLKGHSDEVWSVAFSPDGRYIASGSKDCTIRLWDASTGVAVTDPFTGHTNWVWRVEFSLDGSTLASCSEDKTIRIWDISTGTAIGQPLEGHTGSVTAMALSSDGTRLVSGGAEDRRIFIWDTQTNSAIIGPLRGHTGIIRSVAFSPDGSRVVSGSEDRTIRIWDVLRDSKDPAIDHSRETSVGPIAFTPDRTRFISASSTGALHTWDMHAGTAVSPTFEGTEDLEPIQSIVISPQGMHVAAACDMAVRVWDALTGAIVSQPLPGFAASITRFFKNWRKSSITCLAFSPDGNSICSGSDDSTIIVWNIKTGTMIGQAYIGHTGSVRSVTYSPDGAHIASGATDKTIRVWDPATGTLVHTLSGHNGSVESVGFSPDGRYIISGSDDRTIRKWGLNAPSDSVIYNCYSPVGSVAFSSDGSRVVAGCGSTIRVLNSQITELLSRLSLPYGEIVQWVEFAPNSNDLISTSVSKKEQTQPSTEGSDQKTSQSPNIIRVWRASTPLDQEGFSSKKGYWFERDGRVLSPDGFVIWVPDILSYLGRDSSKTYNNLFALTPEGVIDLKHFHDKHLCIGDRWAECYIHKD